MEHASELEVLERLKEAAKVDSDKSLALLLGLSRQSVAKARATKSVPSSWIPIAAKLFNVSTDWLFFGHSQMHPGDTGSAPQPQPQQPETQPETTPCPRCAKMEAKLDALEEERRELSTENRQLWKENSELKIEVAIQREQLKSLSGRSVAADCA